jgi:hypothetical protein
MKNLLAFFLFFAAALNAQISRTLHENWEFRSMGWSDTTYEKTAVSTEIYQWKTAKVPGVVHQGGAL